MFEGIAITIAGLVEIVLPTKTVRLCDGGFVDWPARGLFTSKDDDFGTIDSVDAVTESVGDEAPGGAITLLPPDTTSAADLFQPEAQGSPIRFWLAELNSATGAVVGTPQLMFDGLVDALTVRTSTQRRSLVVEFMAEAERLFSVREGNVLSPRWHKSIWSGEKGFDHVTGTETLVPWGVPGPGRGTVGGGGSGGLGGVGGGLSSGMLVSSR